MNLPDSFYIALCMTILLVGAVYWVWTQIQYVQRKVNVLENIVYELKTLCSRPPEGPVTSMAAGQYPPPPSSVLGEDEDLLHETLRAEVAPYATIEEMDVPVNSKDVTEVAEVAEIAEVVADIAEVAEEIADFQQIPEAAPDFSEPIFDMGKYVVQGESEHDKGDLQPGGVGSGIMAPSIQSSLEGMTIKELRRLAQQKSISGANEMRKKELIEAIRAVPIDSFLE
jgi:hypothetical protein